jgi:hypothetical protein
LGSHGRPEQKGFHSTAILDKDVVADCVALITVLEIPSAAFTIKNEK